MGMMIVSLTGETPEPEVMAGDAIGTAPVEATAGAWSVLEGMPDMRLEEVSLVSSEQEGARTRRGILAMQCLAALEIRNGRPLD